MIKNTNNASAVNRSIHANLWVWLSLVILFSVVVGFAKSPSSALKDLKKKYSKTSSFQADFQEIFEWKMTAEKTINNGSIIVSRDDRFRMETTEQLIVCNGEAIFRYNEKRNQIIIEPVTEKTGKMLPRRLLMEFADEFDALEYRELAVEGKPGFRLDLVPKIPDEALLTSATIWASSEDHLVRRLMFEDLNGNTTTYIFKNISLGEDVDETKFQFSPPSEAEIIDMR